MSIFDNFLKPSEKDKIRSARMSEELVNGYLGEYANMMDATSHSKYETDPELVNMFSFTIKLISLDFIYKISKDKRVKNVFYASRHSHPGGGSDNISLRHKVIVEYY